MKKIFLILIIAMALFSLEAVASDNVTGNSIVLTFSDTSVVDFGNTTGEIDWINHTFRTAPVWNYYDTADNGIGLPTATNTGNDRWYSTNVGSGTMHDTSAQQISRNSSLMFDVATAMYLNKTVLSTAGYLRCDYWWRMTQTSGSNFFCMLPSASIDCGSGNAIFGKRSITSTVNYVVYNSGWVNTGVAYPSVGQWIPYRLECDGSNCYWRNNVTLIYTRGTSSIQRVGMVSGFNGDDPDTTQFEEIRCTQDAKNTSATVFRTVILNFTNSFDQANCNLTKANRTDIECWVSNNNGTAFINATNKTATFSTTSNNLIIMLNDTGSDYSGGVSRLNVTTSTFTADTTPPSITYYNLTSSDNGCESWNTNKNNACSTSSVTPTVQFNTSENAWCAIAGSSSSTSLDKNYTDMGNSRNCTEAASGEGTTSHLCTLANQDEFVYDTSYLFISCKDSSNNQNKTSTSGALKVSVTSLESDGRNYIGIGIQNALLSGYTNYTDLQIYARNLANNQTRGTFDRAAKKGSKMWAFNRIGVSDSYVNMFNLTPVLYTLEFANKTSSNITLEVEKLINATK